MPPYATTTSVNIIAEEGPILSLHFATSAGENPSTTFLGFGVRESLDSSALFSVFLPSTWMERTKELQERSLHDEERSRQDRQNALYIKAFRLPDMWKQVAEELKSKLGVSAAGWIFISTQKAWMEEGPAT